MEVISVFDMLKIGVGPSSSHTLGPWRAVQRWLAELPSVVALDAVTAVRVELFGSLALTGRGHCTDVAIGLALLGHDPETVPTQEIAGLAAALAVDRVIELVPSRPIPFDPARDISYASSQQLPFHPNGMKLVAIAGDQRHEATFYSIGGGFVVREGETLHAPDRPAPPYPCQSAADLLDHCVQGDLSIAQMVWANECSWRDPAEVRAEIERIWITMRDSVFRGCFTTGELPGGLHVQRRARELAASLLPHVGDDPAAWIDAIRAQRFDFRETLRWVSCFALAVNEENASLGRVVTAPTNGAAGVIPAVLMHHLCSGGSDADAADFLMIAAEIGSLFKKGATISAAMGGCQAEIGVSSAMAAAALAELRGASVGQALMAAEVAMEHHLGMTCDPVGGLVQVPCIERNAMGAIKAINAAELALVSDPAHAKVSLDEVVRTLQQTARDMDSKYKETSQGGLAANISVRLPEC